MSVDNIKENTDTEDQTGEVTKSLHPVLRLFFDAHIPQTYNRASIFVLVLLYVTGILHWLFFLHVDTSFYESHDWWVDYNYYSTLKNAVTEGVVPFHSSFLVYHTTRFLGIPEAMSIFSPQVLLLHFMSIKNFMLVNLLLFYTAGFIGCLLLRNRHRMSLFAFSVFYLLFNYNGHIICHIGVGNYNWIGYFLFPFLLLYLLDLCGEEPTYQSAAKLALVLFFMMLEGSFHMVSMVMIFLGFLLVIDLKNIKRLGLATVLTCLICLFRIWPALTSIKSEISSPFLGFSWTNLITGMAFTQAPSTVVGINAASWEYDHYISPLGLLLILCCGFLVSFRREIRESHTRYTALMIASLSVAVLCMYDNWGLLNGVIPFNTGERIPTRFLITPLLVMVTISCVRMNVLRRHLYGNNLKAMICMVALLSLAVLLLSHSTDWTPRRLLHPGNYFDSTAVKGDNILAIEDSNYKIIVVVSSSISSATLCGIFIFLIRSRSPGLRPEYLWGGAITLWFAFMGAFVCWTRKEPHLADRDMHVITGHPAYVYNSYMPGSPGHMICKVIYKKPLVMRAVGLRDLESNTGGVMWFDAGIGFNTGKLPRDGRPQLLNLKQPYSISWLQFMSNTDEDPARVMETVDVYDLTNEKQ